MHEEWATISEHAPEPALLHGSNAIRVPCLLPDKRSQAGACAFINYVPGTSRKALPPALLWEQPSIPLECQCLPAELRDALWLSFSWREFTEGSNFPIAGRVVIRWVKIADC